MAISYPISIPDTIGIESIELRAINAVSTSQSPFTYKQQVISHTGQRWEASVAVPLVRKDLAAAWKAFLLSLKGQTGTFLLGDPDYSTPRGVASSFPGNPEIISQSGGTVTVTGGPTSKTGWLLAGDYIQIGSGSSATLHQVLLDSGTDASGEASLELWPNLRSERTDSVFTSNPRGLFRLRDNASSWSINSSSLYGISFEAVEVIT